MAESRQDNGGVLFCAVTAVSDCFIKRCQRLVLQTQDAGSGYDIKVGDGEDDSDYCVGRPVGQVVKQRRLSKKTNKGRPTPAVTTASDIEQNLHYRKHLLLRVTVIAAVPSGFGDAAPAAKTQMCYGNHRKYGHGNRHPGTSRYHPEAALTRFKPL